MTYDLAEGAKHVVHDYAYLIKAGRDTQNALPGPYNHYAERTFLVHCRAFGDFFSDREDKRDMFARDFVDTMPAIKLPEWTKWKDHVDKHLMHLTRGRITNTLLWDGAPNRLFLAEFEAAWNAFYHNLKPSVKPAIDEWMSKRELPTPSKPAA